MIDSSPFFRNLENRLAGLFLIAVSALGTRALVAGPVDSTRQVSDKAPALREELVYSVYWSGLKVGKIVVRNHGLATIRERACLKLEADAKTDGPIEKVYKDRRKYIGYLSPGGASWLYEEWERKKNKWRLEEWIGFFPEERLVRRYKKGVVRNTLEISQGVFDPVAAVHHLRNLDLEPGNNYEVMVTQGKYLYRATAEVVKGEILPTPLGEVQTVVAYPKIFWKGKPLGKRDFKVWFTDDERSVPVRLFADVEFGSFSADLIRYRSTQLKDDPFTSPG